MRVIHVTPTVFGPGGLFGGGERYPLELARALAPHVSCRLVAFGRSAAAVRDPSGLEVTVLRAALHLKRHPAHPLSVELGRALAGGDIVHVHQMRSAPGRAAALRAAAGATPAVVTDHGLGGGGWGGLLPRLFRLFLTVSRYSAETLSAPAERTRVIHGGVDPTRFHPDRSAARHGVLFVGRVTPHKNVDGLIRALPRGAHLVVAGSLGHDPRGPERDYPRLLRELAAGRDVLFDTSGVPDERLPELYRSARVLVLPSVHETCYRRTVRISELLGLCLLEAMASGTPVIASRIGGLPEIVRDGETGYLVNPGDQEELHDRLAELLGDPRRAAAMGAAARELVLQHFTWEHCARRCLSAYDELSRSSL
jgi:glycosyltransferase involved in cell wall biosynthesis